MAYLKNFPSARDTATGTPADSLIGRRSPYMIRKGSAATMGDRRDTQYEDDDLETLLDLTEKRPPYDSTGQRAYECACDRYGVVQSSILHRRLADDHHDNVDLRYYGVGPKDALAVCIPLVINTRVSKLNLRGNSLGREGIENICGMMEENTSITELDLSENYLRTHGAKCLAKMLSVNQTLERLDIHDNEFNNRDAFILAKVVEDQSSLIYINLSHNNFGVESADALQRIFGENHHLEEVDLSWNKIRGEAAKALCRGLKDNNGLKILNISWNGFDEDSSFEMAQAIKSSVTLKEINMSCNRIPNEGFLLLVRAAKGHDTLVKLIVGHNPIAEEAVLVAIDLFQNTDTLKLEVLDLLGNIYSRKLDEKLLELRDLHENFELKHGYSHQYGKRKLKSFSVVDEAMGFLKSYIADHNISLIDLFSSFDQDGSMSVTYDEFKEGLKMARIPLTPLQVEALIQGLDQDGDGEIDFGELILGAEEHEQATK